MNKNYGILLVCWLLSVGSLLAGTTGKIAGRVTDRQSGDAIIGANVMITGTNLGASTDTDGY